MEDPQSNPAVDEKPVRKRSGLERVLVWGGIVALLLIALVEGASSIQYNATYKNLETAFGTRDETGKPMTMSVADVDKLIKGFAIRTERTIEEKGAPYQGTQPVKKLRRIDFSWPSLIKSYKIGVSIDNQDQALYFQAIVPGSE